MAVNKTSRGSVNQLLILVTGLVFVIGGILVYLFILQGVYGRFQTEDLIPDTAFFKGIFGEPKSHTAILYSQYTENMLPEGSTWLNDNINTWKKFFGDAKKNYNIITDENIETGILKDYQLLILPGSKSLSDREIVEIKKFLDRGGSLFATSGIGSFSDDGKWRGWEFLSEVFGVRFSGEIKRDELTKIHTLRGGLPITANIPTGYPLKIATWDWPIAVEVLDPRTVQASFWYNYRLQDGLVREEIKKSAGILYGTYGKGRFVWLGFELNSILGVQEDYIYFDRFFNNCVNWLTYNPISFVKDWPSKYVAAAIISPSISNDYRNIGNLLKILESEGIKASFFVDPALAGNDSSFIRTLARHGDIGAIVDLGYMASIDDTLNNLFPYEEQLVRLRESKNKLERISGVKVNGAIPYYGLYNQNSIHALIDAGYKYIFTDSLTDRSVPAIVVKGGKSISTMTKTARDDYEIIRDFGLTDPNFQLYTYQEDVDRILFEGGMYIFKIHPEFQLKGDNAEVVRSIIKDIKSKNFWITTASEVQEWWTRKNSITIRTDKRSSSRIALTISNSGDKIATGIVIEVNINEDARNLGISSEIIGTEKAVYNFNADQRVLNVFINNLKPGESRIYYIDYDRPNS
jgi:peptidoglycan/xylan/chitin deacetylase (PgdA/CDA1 family)